ncbi:oligouridylate-binding protein 1-like [Andrographis paniculata]|uniref:oligouridylate-binding protein 1-like n=1 Tax=Andrographis paniculata TaxID=175694 RepID=UPI0021E7E256|nr:oligouridylate-binding protein 1-like [Andrographis paniculata]
MIQERKMEERNEELGFADVQVSEEINLHGPNPREHCSNSDCNTDCRHLIFFIIGSIVDNLHPSVTEANLRDCFIIAGPVYRCNIIHNYERHYGHVVFRNRQSAIIAIGVLNGISLFEMPLVISWPNPRGRQEDQTSLQRWTTDHVVYAYFSVYDSCVQEHSYRAAHELNGSMLNGGPIRCFLDGSSAGIAPVTNSLQSLELSLPTPPELQYGIGEEIHPQFANICVYNLAPSVTKLCLRRTFNNLNAGTIEHLQLDPGRGLGYVRYTSQYEAALRFRWETAQNYTCEWSVRPTPIDSSAIRLPPELAPGLASARVVAHCRLKAQVLGRVCTL